MTLTAPDGTAATGSPAAPASPEPDDVKTRVIGWLRGLRDVELPRQLRAVKGLRLLLAVGLVMLATLWIWGATALGPISTGRTVALTDILRQAQQHFVDSATLYDDDHRVVV